MRNPCCCMSLRTGALVVGALEVIVYGLTSLFMGFSLGQFVETRKNNETALAELWNKTLQETELHPDLHVDLDGVVLIMSLSIALSFVSCIVGIVCIVGVKKVVAAIAIVIAIEFLIVGGSGELGHIDDGTSSNATKIIPGTNTTKPDVTANGASLLNATDPMAGHSSTSRKKYFENEDPAEYAVMLAVALVTLVFAGLLIYGVIHKHQKLVKAYLFYSAVFIAMSIIAIFTEFVTGTHWVELLLSFGDVMFAIWFWLIVKAYDMEVERGGDGTVVPTYNRFGFAA